MNMYKGAEKVKKVRSQNLRKQFELLQMDRQENISDYITRTQSIVNQTKANGEDVSELQNIEKVL